MLALFSIIVQPDDTYVVSNGSLVHLPPELCGKHRVSQYLKISSEGWTVSELGYLCLHRTTKSGLRYIFPGLYLIDGPKPKKKIYDYKPSLSKKDIETYAEEHIQRSEAQKVQAELELTALIHDLRHLSTAIYHSAEQAERAARDNDRSEIFEGIKTVIATQTMLKARINYLDYTNGVDRFDANTEISVFSRVDKVVRCFSASAMDKRVSLRLSGQSFRLTRGPNILDIVPYTLIDNAIKYSPPNYDVEVSVYDTDDNTVVSVTSVGPDIAGEEQAKIFERGVRGNHATEMRPSGTGLGLAVATEIIEKFGGELSVVCIGNSLLIEKVPHREIRFRFTVPSFGEDTNRMERFEAGRTRRARRVLR